MFGYTPISIHLNIHIRHIYIYRNIHIYTHIHHVIAMMFGFLFMDDPTIFRHARRFKRFKADLEAARVPTDESQKVGHMES